MHSLHNQTVNVNRCVFVFFYIYQCFKLTIKCIFDIPGTTRSALYVRIDNNYMNAHNVSTTRTCKDGTGALSTCKRHMLCSYTKALGNYYVCWDLKAKPLETILVTQHNVSAPRNTLMVY